jgi:hypothetical protein
MESGNPILQTTHLLESRPMGPDELLRRSGEQDWRVFSLDEKLFAMQLEREVLFVNRRWWK